MVEDAESAGNNNYRLIIWTSQEKLMSKGTNFILHTVGIIC